MLSHQRKSLLTSMAVIVVPLLSVMACYTLLYLAQFSEFGPPPEKLQFEVVIFLGLLFAGFIVPFVNQLEKARALTSSVIGLGFAVLVLIGLSQVSLLSPTTSEALNASHSYLLAALVALVMANALNFFFPEKGALYSTMLVYVVCTILANYTLDAFIPVPISTPNWLPFSIEGKINVGTLFFGIIFTQRDRIHQFGKRYAYISIAIAAVANVVVARVLLTPVRFIVASFAAIVLSELTDTEVYQRLSKRRWITRVATSNAFSVPVDSIIFTLFAFWGAEFATTQWLSEVILTDIVVKFLIGLVMAIQVFKFKQTNNALTA